jgi:hypothetical protein
VSAIDEIQTLRQILGKTLEFQIETHHLFIDFKTACDKVNRNELYKAMLELTRYATEFSEINTSHDGAMEGTTAKVKVQNELCESFRIRNGLRH